MTEYPGKVLLAMGGDSAEAEISRQGARAVAEGLRQGGVDLEVIDGLPALRQRLARGGVDRVFNLIHGSPGEDGILQGYLQVLGVPYTGSGVLGSALSMDKIRSKQVWQALGLPVAAGRALKPTDTAETLVQELGLPLVIKPAREGSSVGVHILRTQAELEALLHGLEMKQPMVEAFLAGEEYTVGILQGKALPAIRIQPGTAFYDYEAKYRSDKTRYHCPCGLSGEEERAMQTLALRAFAALACEGWGRVDLIRDAQGNNWLLEVNTTPGMTSHSLVPKAAAQAGMDFSTLVMRILETSEASR